MSSFDYCMQNVAQGFNLSAFSTGSKESASMSGARQNSRGLVTPPNSQIMDISFNAARSLISPPPEETLRRHPVRFLIFLHENELTVYYSSQKNNSQTNYSPDVPSRESSTKRKRRVTTTLSSNGAAFALADALNRAANSSTLENTEFTPNPKPRKLVRHHSKTTSTTDMESPTESCFHQIENLAISTKNPKFLTKKPEITKSPRKQALMQSPHANNSDADYIPPVPISSSVVSSFRRRRSTTPMPIPAYEPPTEQFTPPKEVIVTPIVNVSSRSRKSTARMKVTRPKLKVKTALPAIDLSKPVEPPSPSDDPLLLTGSDIIKKIWEKKTRKAKAKAIKEITPKAKAPSSPLSKDKADLAWNDFDKSNFVNSSEFVMCDSSTDKPIFDLSNENADSGFNSDSDSDCEATVGARVGTGEYTGEFSMFTVPTKASSSTDETEDRSRGWGTPRSPYPFRASEDGRNNGKNVEEEETDEEEQRLSEEGDGENMAQPVVRGGQLDALDSEASFELQNSLQDSFVESRDEMDYPSTQQTSMDSADEAGPARKGSEKAEGLFECLQDAELGHTSNGEDLFSTEQMDIGSAGVHSNDEDSLLEPLDSLSLPGPVSDEQNPMRTDEPLSESESSVHSYGSDSSNTSADDDVTSDRDEDEESGDRNADSAAEQVDHEENWSMDVLETDSLQMGEITVFPKEVSTRVPFFVQPYQLRW
jgi:hypothetical protein